MLLHHKTLIDFSSSEKWMTVARRVGSCARVFWARDFCHKLAQKRQICLLETFELFLAQFVAGNMWDTICIVYQVTFSVWSTEVYNKPKIEKSSTTESIAYRHTLFDWRRSLSIARQWNAAKLITTVVVMQDRKILQRSMIDKEEFH